jgi:hypothetical protein
VSLDAERKTWQVSVCNRGAACAEDMHEVQRRLADPAARRVEVDALRERYRRPNGRVSIPTTAGGGALGILKLIQRAHEESVELEFGVRTPGEPITFLSARGTVQQEHP